MATGDTYGDLGIVVKIADGRPATEDQLGYGALSWDTMDGVVSLPQRGDSVADISEPVLVDGRIEHFNGPKDGGTHEIPLKFIEGEAAQAMLAGKAGGNDTVSFQEVDPDGTAHFYYGRVQSFQRRESSPSTFKGSIAMVAVNSGRFTGTEET